MTYEEPPGGTCPACGAALEQKTTDTTPNFRVVGCPACPYVESMEEI